MAHTVVEYATIGLRSCEFRRPQDGFIEGRQRRFMGSQLQQTARFAAQRVNMVGVVSKCLLKVGQSVLVLAILECGVAG